MKWGPCLIIISLTYKFKYLFLFRNLKYNWLSFLKCSEQLSEDSIRRFLDINCLWRIISKRVHLLGTQLRFLKLLFLLEFSIWSLLVRLSISCHLIRRCVRNIRSVKFLIFIDILSHLCKILRDTSSLYFVILNTDLRINLNSSSFSNTCGSGIWVWNDMSLSIVHDCSCWFWTKRESWWKPWLLHLNSCSASDQ